MTKYQHVVFIMRHEQSYIMESEEKMNHIFFLDIK